MPINENTSVDGHGQMLFFGADGLAYLTQFCSGHWSVWTLSYGGATMIPWLSN